MAKAPVEGLSLDDFVKGTPTSPVVSGGSDVEMQQMFGVPAGDEMEAMFKAPPKPKLSSGIKLPQGADIPNSPDREMEKMFFPDAAFSGLDTAGDQEAGFLPSFKSGLTGIYNGAVVLPAAFLADNVASLAEDMFPGSEMAKGLKISAVEEAGRYEAGVRFQEGLPVSKTMRKLAETDSLKEFGTSFLDSEEKWTVVKELLGGSLPASAAIAGGTMTGGLPGAYLASFITDWGDGYRESVSQGKSLEEAKISATIKAATQAGWDTAAIKAADFVLHGNKVLDFMGQLGVQVLTAGSAEAVKHELVGEDYTMGQVALEASGELFGGPLEIVARRFSNEQLATLQELTDEVDSRVKVAAEERAKEPKEVVGKEQPNLAMREELIELLATRDDFVKDMKDELLAVLEKEPNTVSEDKPVVGGVWVTESKETEERVTALKKGLEINASKRLELGLTPQQRAIIDATEGRLKTDLAQARAVDAAKGDVAEKARGLLGEWTGLFAPELKMVYSTDGKGKGFGQVVPLDEAGLSLVETNLRALMKADGSVNEELLVENLQHKFSEQLIEKEFRGSSPERQGIVTKAYLDWQREKNANPKKYAQKRKDKLRGKLVGSIYSGTAEKTQAVLGFDPEAVEYESGFAEFVADRITDGTPRSGEVGKFLSEVEKQVGLFHGHAAEQYGSPRKLGTFFEQMASGNVYGRLAQKAALEVEGKLDATMAETVAGSITKIMEKVGKGDLEFPENLNVELDSYGSFIKLSAGLTHLQERNSHIKGLKDYLDVTEKWWSDKMLITSRVEENVKLWKKLGTKRGKAFGDFMLDLTVMSYDAGTKYLPGNEEFDNLAKHYNFREEEFALFEVVGKDFAFALDELENTINATNAKEFANDPVTMEEARQELASDMAKLRGLNFFPLTRFGQFFVRTKSLVSQEIGGVTYPPGSTVSFEVFETKAEMKRAARKATGGLKKESGKLTDTQRQFSGFPPEFLKMLRNRLTLTPVQKEELDAILTEIAPGQSFKKHLLARKGTLGYSRDALRGYASYFLHFSNHIAKVRHKGALLDAIGEVRSSATAARTKLNDATKRDEIVEHLQKHYDYIMNPDNEWAALRSIGFIWYLGFVPKSAFVNLTQVPMVTYPYLAARYGDAEAIGAISKATAWTAKFLTNPTNLSRQQVLALDMIEELKKRGSIDESMATEMVALGEGDAIQRLVPVPLVKSEFAGRFLRNASAAAAWMFQAAEKQNRRVTAIAAFNLAMRRGKSYEEAVEVAHSAVKGTQYEYARWNRPLFSRGKRSVLFLFWQYKTNSLYFVWNDPGRLRYLAVLFLFAGLSGLPFAEDAMDFVGFIRRRIAKLTGDAGMKTDVHQWAREIIAEMGANPDLIMHGASRYSFGLPLLGDMVGIPMTNVDFSGSVGQGSFFPGVHSLFGTEGEFDARFARGAQDVGGAVLSIPIQVMRAVADDSPHSLKKWEKAMPTAMRNASKAYRYVVEEGATLPNDAKVAEFDLEDTTHVLEIISQGLGGAPTRVNVAKDKYYATQEHVHYYELWKRFLLRNLDVAVAQGDADVIRKVNADITKYNQTVPFRGLAVTRDDRINSLKARRKDRAKIENGIYTPARSRQVGADLDKAYPILPDVEEEEVR